MVKWSFWENLSFLVGRLDVGLMSKYEKLAARSGLTLKAQARLGIEKNRARFTSQQIMTRICISRRQQNFATAATADCFRMTSRNKNKTDQLVECKRQQKQKLTTTTTTTTTTNVIRIFFAEFLQVFSFKVLTEIAKRIGTRQRPSKLMKRTDLKCKHCKKEIWRKPWWLSNFLKVHVLGNVASDLC